MRLQRTTVAKKVLWAIFSATLLFSSLAFAQGGPPMVTDDPGTPGDGHWEINIATMYNSTYNSTSSTDTIFLPYFDINYGWGDHIQLKVETGYVSTRQAGDHASGVDTTLAGVKWRFLDEEKVGVSVSTYPQYQFPFYASADPNLVDGSNSFFLPIEFSKTIGQWEFNPEIGYLFTTNDTDAVVYGLVIAYEKYKPWELLAELHETTPVGGTTSLLNFGFRYAACKQANIIGATGYTLTQSSDSAAKYWLSYLGVQLEL